jgi:ABC-2 type transport system ATP-binding protein
MTADLKARVTEIEEFVASNELDAATRRLMDFVNDFSTDRRQRRQVINLRGLYSDLRESFRISGKTRRNDILARELRNHILEIMDDIAVAREQPESSIAVKAMQESIQPEPEPVPPPGSASAPEAVAAAQPEMQEAVQTPVVACECIRVSKRFRRGGLDFTLHPITLKLKLGEITAVVGENGSGKTTLLRILARVRRFDKGSLYYPIVPMRSVQDDYLIRQQLVYIPQELPRWSGSILENLQYAASIHGYRGERSEQEVEFILRRLGLEKYRDARWHEISSGFKTRFSLARALLSQSRILILDEPLANLDINTQTIFLQDLRDLTNSVANPMAVIISSQHLHEVENIADNILFLRDGEALYNGPMAIFGEDRTENSFELACDLSKSDLMDAVDDIGYLRIDPEGKHFILHTPREVRASMVLQALLSRGITVRFFRDISKSTRKLFSAP